MIRMLAAPTSWATARWIAWTLFLAAPGSLLVLAIWWISRSAGRRELPRALEAERYLAEATDLPDLERRMRVLERANGGPAFVTFNH